MFGSSPFEEEEEDDDDDDDEEVDEATTAGAPLAAPSGAVEFASS